MNDAVAPPAAGGAYVPKPPPPPLPKYEPPPSRRRLWPALLVGGLALGALTGAVFRTYHRRTAREEAPSAYDVADAFVEGVIRADGLVDPEDPASGTGYHVAYGLLSEDVRRRRTFEDFYEEWALRSDAAGFFERREWANRGMSRAIEQRFILTTAARGGFGRPAAYRMDVRVTPEGGKYAVAAYVVRPVEGDGAK